MSIPFSRSIRLMQRDSFRAGLVTLAFLLVFLVAWVAWFFLARIPVYAASQSYTVTHNGALLASFPAADMQNIQPGQKASLSLPAANGQPAQTIEAEVLDIPADRLGAVEIYLFSSIDPQVLLQTVNGQVKVQVDAVSPASLVWRSAGQWLGK